VWVSRRQAELEKREAKRAEEQKEADRSQEAADGKKSDAQQQAVLSSIHEVLLKQTIQREAATRRNERQNREKRARALRKQRAQYWESARKWLGFSVSFLALIFAGIAAFYAYGQMKAANGQMAAAQAQVSLIQREQRAWIGIKETSFRYFAVAPKVPRAEAFITISNAGITPAFRTEVFHCSQVRDTEPDIELRPEGVCGNDRLGLLIKDVVTTLELPDLSQSIEPNTLAANTGDSGRHLYVWGKISYETADRDGIHTTTFCLLNGASQLGPCTHGGNDAN
jgi:hypothetical protein